MNTDPDNVINLFSADDSSRRASAQVQRQIAEAAMQVQDELIEAWIEFGRHNWLWQAVHRKPSAQHRRRDP